MSTTQTQYRIRIFCLIIIMVTLTVDILSQQLDKIGEEDPLKINGGFSLNQLWRNETYGGSKPYSMVANGNVTASLYGMSIPFSFTWSNEQWTYSQPFNRFSLTPSYKWAKLHLGWSSMSYSNYTLAGHSFLGAGVELSPGNKFRFSAMHGELLKANKGDTIRGYDPQYRRLGTGFKTDYVFDKGEISLMLFHGKDQTQKPVDYIDSLGITPKENLALGTMITLRPTSRISLVSEFHISSLSNDCRISRPVDNDGAATFNYHAALFQGTYNTGIGSIGAGVEYVEPGYETLGAYYTVNDFINYTLNLATSLLKGRINIAANTGIRKNNLNNEADSDRDDIINNVTVGFMPSEKLMFNMSYSNFYNYTHVRPLIDELIAQTEYELMDTLRFTQINESINLGANWRITDTETVGHSVMINLGFQQATQTQNNAKENAGSEFLNASGGYQFSLKASKFNVGLNTNYSRNNGTQGIMESIGPILSVKKVFPSGISGNVSLGWNGTFSDGSNTGNITTARFNTSYTLKKVHVFGFNMAINNRVYSGTKKQNITATLNYSYSFGWPREKEEN